MYFSFLNEYRVTPDLIADRGAKSIGRLRHLFFALPEFQIQEALKAFDPFPEELDALYREIGFGFMYRVKSGKFNTMFDPMTLIHTNRQVGYFATPEIADELACYDTDNQLLFFRTVSNRYLAIDRNTVDGENAIYYRGRVIDDSLCGFLKRFCSDRDYLETLDYEQEQKLREQAKAIEKEKTKQRDKIKHLGGHQLMDRY